MSARSRYKCIYPAGADRAADHPGGAGGGGPPGRRRVEAEPRARRQRPPAHRAHGVDDADCAQGIPQVQGRRPDAHPDGQPRQEQEAHAARLLPQRPLPDGLREGSLGNKGWLVTDGLYYLILLCILQHWEIKFIVESIPLYTINFGISPIVYSE